MTDAPYDLESELSNLLKAMRDQEEEWLLSIFGNYENAQRWGKYYEIEEYPIELHETEDGIYRFTQKLGFRLKDVEIAE
jgi:hypothetical protein